MVHWLTCSSSSYTAIIVSSCAQGTICCPLAWICIRKASWLRIALAQISSFLCSTKSLSSVLTCPHWQHYPSRDVQYIFALYQGDYYDKIGSKMAQCGSPFINHNNYTIHKFSNWKLSATATATAKNFTGGRVNGSNTVSELLYYYVLRVCVYLFIVPANCKINNISMHVIWYFLYNNISLESQEWVIPDQENILHEH